MLSREPAHLIDAISTLGSYLAINYRALKIESEIGDLKLIELLKIAKSSPNTWRAKYEFS